LSKKLKFKPEITRIKLNPEQAVLSCSCYNHRVEAKETSGSYWGILAGGYSCLTLSNLRGHVWTTGAHAFSCWIMDHGGAIS